ncbi:MAG: T9SS C-terminal target domain-containing protein [Bacteroidetes bacterium]|nr:MAG: T9SS C-terminal target domain-containing protein [Bacteroidota bacterium]
MKAKILFVSLLVSLTIFTKGFAQHTYADWSKHIVGHENSSFNNILFDGEAIIANGFWTLEADFDSIELPNHIGSNGLIVKKDLEGNTIWHSTMTGDGWNQFFDFTIDSEKNIIAAGWSTSIEYIEINGVLVHEPDMEWTTGGVAAKFSGEDGSLIWFKVINPEDDYYSLIFNKIAVDADDNIYISGYANNGFEIDGIEFPYTQEGWGGITFLAKFDPDGLIVWGEQFHFVEEGDAGWSFSRSIEVVNDDIYFAFQYSKPVNVGDDVLPYEGEGYYDWIGLVNLSTQDGQVLKTNAYGSSSEQNIASLTFDNDGNILVAGFFTSGSDFGIDGVSPMSYGTEDGYVAKLNNELELIWLKSMGSEFSSRCFNLSVSNDNRIFVGGGFDSYTPLYFEGHKLIDGESPTNSLAMFQVVLDEDGAFEKAFALHGEDIYSIVEYKDAVVFDNDIVMAVGASLDNVGFVEDSLFYSDHWAGFLIKWDLSKEYYKIFFDVKDEDGNSLDNAVVTLEGTANPFNKHSFYQIDQGVYGYSVTLEGYVAIEGEAEVIDQDILVPVTMTSTNTSVSNFHTFSISLFPNPASSGFSITSEVEVEHIIISDATGRSVHQQPVGAKSTQIDIQELPSGLYLVRITTKNGIATKKLQIVK